MVTPTNFELSINYKKNILSLILLEIQKLLNYQMLFKSLIFKMCYISKSIEDRYFYVFTIDK